jgi:hypothetical protein
MALLLALLPAAGDGAAAGAAAASADPAASCAGAGRGWQQQRPLRASAALARLPSVLLSAAACRRRALAGVNGRGELLALTIPTEKSRSVCKVSGRQQLQLPQGPARLAALRGHLLLAHPGGLALLNVTARGAPQLELVTSNADLAALFGADVQLGEAAGQLLHALVSNEEAFVGVALLPGTLGLLRSTLPANRPQELWWIKLLRPVLLVSAVCVGGMQFVKGRRQMMEGQRRLGRRGRGGGRGGFGGDGFDDDEDFMAGGMMGGGDPLALGRMSRAAREMRRRYPHVDFDRVMGGADGGGGGGGRGPRGSRSSGDGDDEGDAARRQAGQAGARRSRVRFSDTVQEFPAEELREQEEEEQEEEQGEGLAGGASEGRVFDDAACDEADGPLPGEGPGAWKGVSGRRE